MQLFFLILLLPAVFLSACTPFAWLSSPELESVEAPRRQIRPEPSPVEPVITLPNTNIADAPAARRDDDQAPPPAPLASAPGEKQEEYREIGLLNPKLTDSDDYATDEATSASLGNSVAAYDQEVPKSEPRIPLVVNDRVRHFVDLYSKRQRIHFAQALARSGKYVPRMAKILREENVPQELVYIALVESSFSPTARSASNAVGLWQFIRSTGNHYGLKIDWWVDERRDPFKATRAAAAYFRDLYERFGRWYLAAAAYNAGGGKVAQALSLSGAKDFWSLSAKSDLSEETRNFVPKFIAASLIAKEPVRYGLDEIAYEPPLSYDEVEIRNALRLDTVARLAQTTVAVIRELNPALLRNYTPPAKDGYFLRVPAGKGDAFLEAYNRDHRRPQGRVLVHQIKRGETLSGIAKKYGTRVSRLMEENSLRNHRIRSGDHLIVVAGEASKRR